MITVYHIPVCPFSQRLEILLSLKGRQELVDFVVIDITKPRPEWLLEKSRGTTALPILETSDGTILKESLVILQYLEELTADHPVAQECPKLRAIENMLVGLSAAFAEAGYSMILNQDFERRGDFESKLLNIYRRIDDFLQQHSKTDDYLFDAFGWAEVAFTPLLMRFWFLEYYESFRLPDTPEFQRVRCWRNACLDSPNITQVTQEQIVKLYYDYAKGAGNGNLVPGRAISSFVFEPNWRQRPWPPADKYSVSASDEELGLLQGAE